MQVNTLKMRLLNNQHKQTRLAHICEQSASQGTCRSTCDRCSVETSLTSLVKEAAELLIKSGGTI